MDIGDDRLRRPRWGVRRRGISSWFAEIVSFIIYSFSVIYEAFELLGKHKKLALAVFFLILEAAALGLHIYGQSRRSILLAAFLLSIFGFVTTIFTSFLERSKVHAEKHLGAVEIGFSVVQLIATFLAFLGIKIMNNYNDSILLLVFALIAVVFVYAKYENNNFIVSSSSSFSNDHDYETELLSTMANSHFNNPKAEPYNPVNPQFDFDRELQYGELLKKYVERYNLRPKLSVDPETNPACYGA